MIVEELGCESRRSPQQGEADDRHSTKSEGHQTGDREITDAEKSKVSREQQPVITLDEEGSKTLEILKSVVYGGLMESMTSLSVVSSAAAADATTTNTQDETLVLLSSFLQNKGGIIKMSKK
ncbi:Membrane protein of ER body 1 [Camellia lanceoleosa]|uniref:Membrane protein of ER body 1 n=1 Tax=Camellia lanceoleosa TaxID=1840588 RepID=A0ACC0FZ02_9ERIC|nr:Membrane protein of ER body 1 [Camellia lanceoleosa]